MVRFHIGQDGGLQEVAFEETWRPYTASNHRRSFSLGPFDEAHYLVVLGIVDEGSHLDPFSKRIADLDLVGLLH